MQSRQGALRTLPCLSSSSPSASLPLSNEPWQWTRVPGPWLWLGDLEPILTLHPNVLTYEQGDVDDIFRSSFTE